MTKNISKNKKRPTGAERLFSKISNTEMSEELAPETENEALKTDYIPDDEDPLPPDEDSFR